MPIDVRTSGISLAYSLATAISGGFTPAICTYLIHVTGHSAVPSLWLATTAICGLIAACLAKADGEREVLRIHAPLVAAPR